MVVELRIIQRQGQADVGPIRAKANHMDSWRRAFIKGGNL